MYQKWREAKNPKKAFRKETIKLSGEQPEPVNHASLFSIRNVESGYILPLSCFQRKEIRRYDLTCTNRARGSKSIDYKVHFPVFRLHQRCDPYIT